VLPEQIEMADRDRAFNAWCGDVYKVIPVLREFRPDLTIHVFEAFIGPYRKGIATITNLDPANRVLEEQYDAIAPDLIGDKYTADSIPELEKSVTVSRYKEFKKVVKQVKKSSSLFHKVEPAQ
ncbi:MAG: hypothetical protein AAF986_07365, partial [Pseudomonadota bacterium]